MFKRRFARGLVVAMVCFSCTHPVEPLGPLRTDYRITYNPYGAVDWSAWHRLRTQHHDHTIAKEAAIRAYDAAGYDAIVSLHYAGVPALRDARRERLWPTYRFLSGFSSDADFLATTSTLKFFIPAMEEVGRDHMTSAFLTSYIELRDRLLHYPAEPWQYRTSQECADLIDRFDGVAVLAHPDRSPQYYARLDNIRHVEIYNAYYRYHFAEGNQPFDRNHHFLKVWDYLLAHKSSRIWGVAVNDWYGPPNRAVAESHPDVYDSGKTLVLVAAPELASYRRSFEDGAFFAIRDNGSAKGAIPQVQRIKVDQNGIHIESEGGSVVWIFRGTELASGPEFSLQDQLTGLNYVRAEVRNTSGVVYLQPFSLEELSTVR